MLLQSGELMNAYTDLLYHAEETLRDLETIMETAITAPGRDVSRHTALARERLDHAVTRARAITHPEVDH